MLKGSTVAEKIWNFLYDKIKNEYAVAGLMGNLYAESGLSPINLQDSFEKKLGMNDSEYTKAIDKGTYSNFVTDKAGYGLAQWTYYTRKQKLLDFAKKSQSSIGDLEMQLNFLIYELQNSFKPLWKKLQNISSVKAASDAVLLNFEKPLDQSKAVKDKRAAFATYYYDNYASKKTNIAEVTDKESKTQVVAQENLKIIQSFGINNTNYLANRKLEWIVIHYTAGTSSKGGAALNCAIGARTGGLSTSAEFYVDDTSVVQYIQDIKNRYSWSVGGAKWDKKYTSLSGIYYGKCTNQNSINIEICSNKTNKKSLSGDDTDWYFTESELKLAAALVRKLMHDYNIDLDHVIMHHEVNGKTCLPYDNTELLTPDGWKPLEDISIGDMVVQYDKDNNYLCYGPVKDIVEAHEEKVFKLRGFEATASHRSITRGAVQNAVWNVRPWEIDYKSKQRVFMTSGIMDSYKGLPLSDEEIQLLVWIQGDGHYMKSSYDKTTITGIEFHLKKTRKILRIKEILDSLGYEFKENWCQNGSVHIRVYDLNLYYFAEKWLKNKIFTYQLLDMTIEQFNIFWNELLQVDGSIEKNSYCSSIQQNYDVVQALCATHGRRTLQTTTGNSTSLISTSANLNSTSRSTREERTTVVGCVTVPTGFILIRQSGRTFITGNCPQMWCYNESRLSEWKRFLQMVKGEEVKLVTSIANTMPSPTNNSNVPYLVLVTAAALNVRNGPSIDYKVNTVIKDKGKYTIVEEKNGWGKLKSGAGWINLKYTIKN